MQKTRKKKRQCVLHFAVTQPSTSTQPSNPVAGKTREGKRTIPFKIGQEVYISDSEEVTNRGPSSIAGTASGRSDYYYVGLESGSVVEVAGTKIRHNAKD